MSFVIPRLESHRIFHTQNPEEAHSFLASKNFCVDFPVHDRTPLDAHINGIYLPGIYVGYFCYGRETTLKATPVRTDYWFQFATQERFEIEVGKQRITCDSRQAAVLSPTHENVIRSERGCGRLALSLTRDALVRQLTALLGDTLQHPIEFAPSMDIAHGYGRSLTRYLCVAADDFEQGDSLLHNALAMSAFEQFIITALLVSHPHNYSAALKRPEPSISPRDVKRAIDFMEGHLTTAISLADVVESSGVSGRALFKHFRKYTRHSPIGYLREARFRCVRDALQSPDSNESITSIASRFGFDHIGRFAVEYHRRFGEKPSETRQRATRCMQ